MYGTRRMYRYSVRHVYRRGMKLWVKVSFVDEFCSHFYSQRYYSYKLCEFDWCYMKVLWLLFNFELPRWAAWLCYFNIGEFCVWFDVGNFENVKWCWKIESVAIIQDYLSCRNARYVHLTLRYRFCMESYECLVLLLILAFGNSQDEIDR